MATLTRSAKARVALALTSLLVFMTGAHSASAQTVDAVPAFEGIAAMSAGVAPAPAATLGNLPGGLGLAPSPDLGSAARGASSAIPHGSARTAFAVRVTQTAAAGRRRQPEGEFQDAARAEPRNRETTTLVRWLDGIFGESRAQASGDVGPAGSKSPLKTRIGFIQRDDAEAPASGETGDRVIRGFGQGRRKGGSPPQDARPEPGRKIGFVQPAEEPRPRKAAGGERVILLTGFEPFLDYRGNSAQSVAERLDGLRVELRRDGAAPPSMSLAGQDLPSAKALGRLIASYRIVSKILPVSFDRSGEMIESLIQEHTPDVLLMLGQSGRTPNFEVELMAKNVAHSPAIPDADGLKPEMEYVLPAAPAGHVTNAPVHDLVRWLRGGGVPAILSSDAGTFVCNSLFYFALNAVRSLGTPTMVSFVHLPPATEHLSPQQADRLAHWPLGSITDAAAKMVQWFGWAHDAVKKRRESSGPR